MPGAKREFKFRLASRRQEKEEFQKLHSNIRAFKPFILLFNIFIWYFLFGIIGIGYLTIIFAVSIGIKGIMEFYLMASLEQKLLKPIEKLKSGVDQIGNGNYDVNIEFDEPNVVKPLIDSFNDMALKLNKAEKLKNEYEENRKNLIASISHDLKTPITSIQGYAEFLQEKDEMSSEDIKKYLRIINSNTSYMNKLIDDLFLFSKLDIQKLDFEYRDVNIGPFMDDLMEEFKIELEDSCEGDFSYKNTLDGENIVKLDGKRFHQSVRNIIGNSIKYGPEKGLSISVVMRLAERNVEIEIADNGPGIPEDKLPYIFERFYRVDNERTKDLSSTGLGLAIARELIEAHGGKISASNSEYGGAVFKIVIPLKERV